MKIHRCLLPSTVVSNIFWIDMAKQGYVQQQYRAKVSSITKLMDSHSYSTVFSVVSELCDAAVLVGSDMTGAPRQGHPGTGHGRKGGQQIPDDHKSGKIQIPTHNTNK